MKAIKCFLCVISGFLLMSLVSCDNYNKNASDVNADTLKVVSVAYVKMDSLLLNYNVYKKMSQDLIKEEEQSRINFKQRAESLQKEIAEFQNKIQHNAFLSQQRALSEQDRLLRKQQDLQELGVKIEQDLVIKQQKMNEQLYHNIDSVLKAYNESAKYDFILTNTSVLLGNDKYDITDEVLKELNKGIEPAKENK
jgi:outer membrane protein